MKRRGFYLLLLIGLVALSVSACIAPESAFDADPIASYAHGTYVWEDGITEPDREYMLAVQNHYILKYQAIVGRSDTEEANRIKSVLYEMVADDILANGLYLDWLIQQAGDERFSRDAITTNTVRLYYIEQIQDDPLPFVVDGYWTKGIDIDLVRALQLEGLDVFEPVPTANSDFANECISAGVPVPDRLYDGQWDSFGTLDKLLNGNPNFHNEIHMYVSEEPPGFCMSLTRSSEPDADKGHIDLICMGQESGKACFFEAVGFDNDIDGPVAISDLSAGDNIVSPDAPCTRCHIGENPLIIHPQDLAFVDSLAAKSMELDTPPTWNVKNYYEPFEVPSWPPNPPPLDLESIWSEKQCNGCHVQSYAGRFPDVSQMPDPTSYDPYCNVVVRRVLQGSVSPIFSPTMPLGDIPNTAAYAAHKNLLLAMCDKPDEGVLVDNTFDDDPSFLSPPRISPPYACAEAVYVVEFVDEAEVELIINDIVVGVIAPVLKPGPIEFSLSMPLEVGDKIQARQTANGTPSERSKPVFALDYKEHYPDGLPAPTIDPSTIYACSSVMAVRYDISGFAVEVLVNGGDPVTARTFAGHLSVTPGKTPFEFDDEFTAQVSACGDVSPVSDVVKAQRPSSDVLTEAQINPLSFYESQELINIGNLTHGSSSEILESSAGQLGSFSTPLSWKIARLGQPLALSDQLAVSQNLCEFSSQPSFSTSPPVLSCSSLPAPEIKDPLPGQDFVSVKQPLLGARVRIYDESGNELGDGTGGVIVLNRTLTDGESITAVQQLGDCISSQGFQIEV